MTRHELRTADETSALGEAGRHYLNVREMCVCVLYVGFFLDDGMGKLGWTGSDWIGLDYLLTYLGKKKRFMWFYSLFFI